MKLISKLLFAALLTESAANHENTSNEDVERCLTGIGPLYDPQGAPLHDYNVFKFAVEFPFNTEAQKKCVPDDDSGMNMTCKTRKVFNHKAVESICDAEGGIEMDFNFVVEVPGQPTYVLKGLPVCAPDTCVSQHDIFLGYNLVVFPQYVQLAGLPEGSRVSLQEDKTGGLQCFEETLLNYGFEIQVIDGVLAPVVTKMTALTQFFPTLLNGLDDGYCDVTIEGRDYFRICDASKVLDPAVVKPLCDDAGGKYIEMDQVNIRKKIGYIFGDITLNDVTSTTINAAFCMAQLCKTREMVGYYQSMTKLLTPYAYVHTTKSKQDDCDEKRGNIFFVDNTKGRCGWLSRQPFEMKEKFCENVWSARGSCPVTCNRCEGRSGNKFLKMKRPDGTHASRTCAWLEKQPLKVIKKYCERKYFRSNQFPSAYSACPQICL